MPWIIVGAIALGALLVLFFALRPQPEVKEEKKTPAGPDEKSGLRKRPQLAKDVKKLEVKPLYEDDEDLFDDDDDDDEITVLRVALDPKEGRSEPPVAAAEVIYADEAAEHDIPTDHDLRVLTTAIAQTNTGKKRERNEDRFLKLSGERVYAVADGMGGYAGGHIAAEMAVELLEEAFTKKKFHADIRGPELPWRAAELAKAVQRANLKIYERGKKEPWLKDMGTTIVAARFAGHKERLYVAHVGDSRCYRLREGKLRQLTTDHTFGNLGVVDDGPTADALSRAVGATPGLTIDVIIAETRPGDVYLLCTDGLTRMVPDEATIADTIDGADSLQAGADRLVELALEGGGKDNVTVVLVEVTPAEKLLGKPRDAASA
ncbi:MAG: protein phosphatase 2C domain-containing protein [Myxococcota bacterium]|nr:protein phosphatase 2C domain-containing protein [Myxococcota bacterium]